MTTEAADCHDDIKSCTRRGCRFNGEPVEFFDRLLKLDTEHLNNSAIEPDDDPGADRPVFGYLIWREAE